MRECNDRHILEDKGQYVDGGRHIKMTLREADEFNEQADVECNCQAYRNGLGLHEAAHVESMSVDLKD